MPIWYYLNMETLNKIQNQVSEAFAHLDAQEIQQETAYILETADMIMDLQNNPIEGKSKVERYGSTHLVPNQMIAMEKLMRERGIDSDMKGTIVWNRANAATHGSDENIVEAALKPLKAKHETRNYRIAKKLFDKGVKEFDLNNQEIVWGGDFETKWKVEDLMVTLKVIFAGGYNIQRYHPRILVNVK